MAVFEQGDRVTVMPPYINDGPLIATAPRVIVSAVHPQPDGDPLYEVEGPWTVLVGQNGVPIRDEAGNTRRQTFGPYPARRLQSGWKL